jgi:hypothetical protein
MSSNKLGSSGKYLVINLGDAAPPFKFSAAFAAAYPNSSTSRTYVSRAIVALDGPGTLTLIDAEGEHVDWPMMAYEVNEIEAVGVYATDGIAQIKVML